MQGAAESWLQLTGPLKGGHSSWHHWPLTSRYGSAHLPQVSLIDLRLSKPEAGKWLSAEMMMEAVMARLEAGAVLVISEPPRLCADDGLRRLWSQADLSSM